MFKTKVYGSVFDGVHYVFVGNVLTLVHSISLEFQVYPLFFYLVLWLSMSECYKLYVKMFLKNALLD